MRGSLLNCNLVGHYSVIGRVLSLHPPVGILGVQKFFCTKPFRKVHSELSPHTSGRRARFARAPP